MFMVKMLVAVNGEPKLINPCGTDYTRIIDLKTCRGVKHRINNMFIPNDVEKIEIHRVIGHVLDDNMVLMDRLIKFDGRWA